jgi:hypothetical protein
LKLGLCGAFCHLQRFPATRWLMKAWPDGVQAFDALKCPHSGQRGIVADPRIDSSARLWRFFLFFPKRRLRLR